MEEKYQQRYVISALSTSEISMFVSRNIPCPVSQRGWLMSLLPDTQQILMHSSSWSCNRVPLVWLRRGRSCWHKQGLFFFFLLSSLDLVTNWRVAWYEKVKFVLLRSTVGYVAPRLGIHSEESWFSSQVVGAQHDPDSAAPRGCAGQTRRGDDGGEISRVLHWDHWGCH